MWVLTHIENGEHTKNIRNSFEIGIKSVLRIIRCLPLLVFLFSSHSGQRLYILTNKTEYIVGRDNADLLVADDPSISRQHAKIQCLATCIKVLDANSKYGVFVNGGIETNKAIDKNKPLRVEVGDTIRFGRMRAIFRVEKIDIKVCTSTLDDGNVAKLKSLLQLVGGRIESSWTVNCTHLVMPTIIVTVKVLQSLAHGIPIVTPKYFVEYIQSAQSNKPQLPNVNDFVPKINEPYIIKEPKMMHVHLERQRLFQNKTFIFMVKSQMMAYKQVIELAGGKCKNLQTDRVKRSALLETNNIPMQYTSSGNSQCSSDVADTADYINENQRRLIPDNEIGLALLHRSIERFCNPDYQMVSAFNMNTATPLELRAKVLVEATPVDDLKFETELEVYCVPETIEQATSESNNNDIIVDSEKPSTSSAIAFERPQATTSRVTRRSAALSKRTHNEANTSSDSSEMVDEIEPPAPAKKQKTVDPKPTTRNRVSPRKRAVAELEEPIEPIEHIEPPVRVPRQEAAELEASTSSAMPSQSTSRIERISGFMTTQKRTRNTDRNESQSQASQQPCKERTVASRKRVLGMLDCDDDDSNNESTGDIFGLNRKQVVKRSRTNAKEVKKISLDSDDEDDDDGNLFAFGATRNSQVNRTNRPNRNANNNSEMNQSNETNSSSTQDSFKKPYQHVLNRSTFVPLAMPPAQQISTEWITAKTERLNLSIGNATALKVSVNIKEERLEEWEMSAEEKKRRFINSVRNGFQVRTIDLTQSRLNQQSMTDETDGSMSINPGDSTLKHGKNFKCFVKVRQLFCLWLA